jgi:hypothetical protein
MQARHVKLLYFILPLLDGSINSISALTAIFSSTADRIKDILGDSEPIN